KRYARWRPPAWLRRRSLPGERAERVSSRANASREAVPGAGEMMKSISAENETHQIQVQALTRRSRQVIKLATGQPGREILNIYRMDVACLRGESVDRDKSGDHSVMLIKTELQTGSFKLRVVLEVIVLPLLTMVTCKKTRAVFIVLHKKGFSGKDIAVSKIAPKSTIYRIIKNFKESGSIVVKKASGRPRKSSKCKDRLLKLIQLRDWGTTSAELDQE
ncbi:unnamed protein product, partial [Pleuronectes platessa]